MPSCFAMFLFISLASVSLGQIVGVSVLVAVSAAAGYAVWVLNDGSQCRCPRCRAEVGRFVRRCPRCQREIVPVLVEKNNKIRERQMLAAELTFFIVLAVGGLILAPRDHSPSKPAPVAALHPPTFAPALPSSRVKVTPQMMADHPWPIANEELPSNARPGYDRWVEASKRRAILEYPALGVSGSAFQNALIARYRQLSNDQSPRLADPRWPEELANEVAMSLLANGPRNAGQP